MYSQHEEEGIITKFFDSKPGRFLDIGAYNGVIFSNTRKLFELDWSGVCVEASPKCFTSLQELYKDVNNVKLVCAALHDQEGCFLFYDNGGAVATMSKEHMKQWDKDQDFSEIFVASVTPAKLLKVLPGPYDFLSIDIEDATIPALGAFPSLKDLGVKLVCIEAYSEEEKVAVKKIMDAQGYVLHASTILNVLYKVQP